MCIADSATDRAAPDSIQSLIPLDYRQGDFSRFGNLIYDPATTQITAKGIVRQPFPGNRIPQDRISPVSQKILAQLPNPINNNLFKNFTSIGRGATDSNQYNLKLDHSLTNTNRLSGYYYQDAFKTREPELIPGPATSSRASGSFNHWARISHDYVFSPTMLNHLNVGFTRFRTTIEAYSVDQNKLTSRVGAGSR